MPPILPPDRRRILAVGDSFRTDIAGAKAGGTLGLILGFQNTAMLERDLARLEVFHRLGVRIIQLTYNERNIVGDGCLEPGDAGLSAFGRQVEAGDVAGGIASKRRRRRLFAAARLV